MIRSHRRTRFARSLAAVVVTLLGVGLGPHASAQSGSSPIALLKSQTKVLRIAPNSSTPSHTFYVDAAGPVALDLRAVTGDLIWAIALPPAAGLPAITSGNVVSGYGGSCTLLPDPPPASPKPALPIPMLSATAGYTYLIAFVAPVPGPYMLQIMSMAPVQESPILVDVRVQDSALGVAMFPTVRNTPQGDDAILSIALADGEDPAPGATIAAEIVRPNRSRITALFADNGAGYDAVAGDGLYTAVFRTRIDANTLEPVGEYAVVADITGTNALGNTFVRSTATSFEVVPRCAELPANFAASTVVQGLDLDQPPDLCLDVVEFAVSGFTAYTPGTYRLRLDLHPQGLSTRRLTAEGEVEIGAATVGVPTVIRARATIRGRDLWLFRPARSLVVDAASLSMVLDGAYYDCGTRTASDPYQGLLLTPPLDSQLFAGWTENWTGNDAAYPYDLAGNLLPPWDGLYVQMGLNFHFGGFYRLQATLEDECGTFIDKAEQVGLYRVDANDEFGTLADGKYCAFGFSGQKIGSTATSGRFRVRVRATSITALENIEDHVYTTPFYAVTEFVGYADRNKPGDNGGWRDINRNGISDQCEINSNAFVDLNGNGVWDAFEPFGNGCTPDYNRDGVIDPDDLGDFITAFFSTFEPGQAPPCLDFNGDGVVNPDDLGDFITTTFERDWNAIITAWCQAHATPCYQCGGSIWMEEDCQ